MPLYSCIINRLRQNWLEQQVLLVVHPLTLIGRLLLGNFCINILQGFSPELNPECGVVLFCRRVLILLQLLFQWLLLLVVHFRSHNEGPRSPDTCFSGTIAADTCVHSLGRSPSWSPRAAVFMKKRKHLLSLVHAFPLWNSACRLIKLSLTGKTHSTEKNQYTPLCYFTFFYSLCESMCSDGVSLSIIKENDELYHITLPWQV